MRGVAIVIGVLGCIVASVGKAETYGNYTTMGVIVDPPAETKIEDIGRVGMFLLDGPERRAVHDLARVGRENFFAGCLFWLQPATRYQVEVEFYDRGGKLISKVAESGQTRAEPVVPQTKDAVYVAATGEDGNPGTLEKPLKTIKAGLNKLTGGMTLFVRGGRYYEGDLDMPAKGSAQTPVVIRAYGDERVIIDGDDPALIDGKWEKSADDTFNVSYSGQTWDVSMEEKASGKYYRLYPLRTMAELTGRKSANKTFKQLGFTGAFYCDGKRIHVVTPGGDIADYRVHVANHTIGLQVTGTSSVAIQGLEFRHFGKNEYGCAINLLDSSQVLIQKCEVYYTNSGVWIKGQSNNNTIQDSLFVDDVNHWHFSYSKNEEGWNYHDQIETGAAYTDGDYTGRGLVVRRNRIEGIFDGSHLGPWEKVNARTSETDFYENIMEGITDDFVETDGFSRNVRIFDNRMNKSLSGISLAQALDGPTWILYNTLENCGISTGTTLESYEGYPFKTNGGPSPRIGSGPVFFYHNTAWTSDPRSRAMLVKSNVRWKQMVLKNNIWCGKGMGFDKWSGDLSSLVWDYDDLYHAAGPFMKMDKTIYPDLVDVQKAKGWMTHGISADPRFVAPETGDFHLQPNSPCIDAGTVLPGINDGRYHGKAPDIGCFEAD